MRPYVVITGLLFALLFAVHMARLVQEGVHVMSDPFFSLSTLLAALLAAWAVRLLLASRRA